MRDIGSVGFGALVAVDVNVPVLRSTDNVVAKLEFPDDDRSGET